MGMIMHDDVPYGEGTSYTQGTGIAINNNVIAVDADNTPTENSEKPVKSKGVYSALESSREESTTLLKSTVGWTGKNLLSHTRQSITTNGITFTINSDGSVTANGTATKNASIEIWNTDKCKKFFKNYKGKGFTFSGGNNGVEFGAQSLHTESIGEYSANGIEKTITVRNDVENAGSTLSVKCLVRNGVTVDDITIYPMIRDASITDDTYEPYHESVEEEIEQIYADNGVLGAKNLLSYTQQSLTTTGITFTINSDGSVTVNGTATANASIEIWNTAKCKDFFKNYKGKKFTFSGGNNGVEFGAQSLQTEGIGEYSANGIEKTITVRNDVENASPTLSIKCLVRNGVTIDNITIYPMMRLASDPDDTYVPYAMTNRELTEEKLSISELKTIASSATDFAAFKTAIANL